MNRITIVGVGNAGCRLVDSVAKSKLGDKVKTVAIDNEADGVNTVSADVVVALKKGEARTLHQPRTVEVSRNDALEVYNEIKKVLMQ